MNFCKDSLSDNSMDSLVESDDSSQSLFDLTLEEKVSPTLNFTSAPFDSNYFSQTWPTQFLVEFKF